MPKKAVSKTVSRLNQDLRRELIAIIEGMKDPRLKSGLLTVTRVEAAPDLSSAKVFVSVLGGEVSTTDVVAFLDKAKGHVRSEVASRMHIRHSPELLFLPDEGAAYAAHINDLLKDLK